MGRLEAAKSRLDLGLGRCDVGKCRLWYGGARYGGYFMIFYYHTPIIPWILSIQARQHRFHNPQTRVQTGERGESCVPDAPDAPDAPDFSRLGRPSLNHDLLIPDSVGLFEHLKEGVGVFPPEVSNRGLDHGTEGLLIQDLPQVAFLPPRLPPGKASLVRDCEVEEALP